MMQRTSLLSQLLWILGQLVMMVIFLASFFWVGTESINVVTNFDPNTNPYIGPFIVSLVVFLVVCVGFMMVCFSVNTLKQPECVKKHSDKSIE